MSSSFPTKMVRTHGRCRRGRRLIGKAPWGHWKTTTFTAALRCDGLVAPFVLDGPANGQAFLVYVETVLASSLSQGDIVVIDNLPAHKVEGVRAAIERTGANLRYLPPIRPISTPSRWHSQKQKPCCARPPREHRTNFGCHRRRPWRLHAKPMRQLPGPRRLCLTLSGKCS